MNEQYEHFVCGGRSCGKTFLNSYGLLHQKAIIISDLIIDLSKKHSPAIRRYFLNDILHRVSMDNRGRFKGEKGYKED